MSQSLIHYQRLAQLTAEALAGAEWFILLRGRVLSLLAQGPISSRSYWPLTRLSYSSP